MLTLALRCDPSRAIDAMRLLFMTVAALAATIAAGADVRVVTPAGSRVSGPRSPGVLAGDFLYVSGQDGHDAAGRRPDTIDGEVRQALLNLKVVVEAAGLTLRHVVYSQVYLADMAHQGVVDRVWREVFPSAPPARALLGVHALPGGSAVTIDAVAYRDLAARRSIVPPGYAGSLAASPAVMAGTRLFLSGALGADVATGEMPADPDAQVQLALDNLGRVLAAAGVDFRHLVFVNPYLTTAASRRMNDIYARRVEFGNTPARATINVTSLPGGNTIQFTGVAVADLSLRRAYRPANMRPSATASPCVLADDTYYCSAKGPFTPGPAAGPPGLQGIWAATVEAQVRQTMRNLIDGLEEAGLGLSQVVSANVYLDDIDDLDRVDRVYAQYFPERLPARTTVAQVAPQDRTPRRADTFPGLEQISLIAVK